MNTCIAFFRGINVGGNNMLPMKSLAALMTKLGYDGVQTYIQSGNVVFRSDKKDAAVIEEHIAGAVTKAHGFKPRILVLSDRALLKAIKENPFPDATANHKSLHLWFLAAPCSKPRLDAIEELKARNESFVLTKSVFYFHAPDGIGKSKLAGRIEKLLGVDATARNWQTVTKVSEIARGI
jgi:uncharacterized protein (DUF1697 family)